MIRLGAAGQKWLKGLHLVAVASWIGGGISLLVLYFLKPGVTDGGVLYGINQAAHHVDRWVVVVLGAFGCLLTGLAYSLLTGWGFVKHGWVLFKWAVTLSAIVFGTLGLGPWERTMMTISGQLGMDAVTNVSYLYNQDMNFAWGCVQVAVLLATVFVSIFKPWKNLRKST
jgi:hypothetical protein